jgi:hypothetical protein
MLQPNSPRGVTDSFGSRQINRNEESHSLVRLPFLIFLMRTLRYGKFMFY